MCTFQRHFHLWIFSEILMIPSPFLREQFNSDNLTTTQRPMYQNEKGSIETFSGSVLVRCQAP